MLENQGDRSKKLDAHGEQELLREALQRGLFDAIQNFVENREARVPDTVARNIAKIGLAASTIGAGAALLHTNDKDTSSPEPMEITSTVPDTRSEKQRERDEHVLDESEEKEAAKLIFREDGKGSD